MRVIAGEARSLLLDTPKGDGTRPTTDRIKETLFNMIQTDFPGGIFVDLFAGSGAIGIEALSRGAKKAYFVENGREALDCIERNLKHTKLIDKAVILRQDAITAIGYGIREHIDVLFCDPPYGKGYDEMILNAALKNAAIDEDTLIIIEELKDTDFSYALDMGYRIKKEKIYKSNKHVFLYKSTAC